MARTLWNTALVIGLWALMAVGLVARTPESPWPWLVLDGPEDQVDEVPPLAEGPEKEHREAPYSDLGSMFPGLVILRGPGTAPQIALTFDDGPDDTYTPAVLDILAEHDVRATFFLIGSRVEEMPEMARRVVEEGHALGHHGYHHVRYSALSRAQIHTDLTRGDDAFYRATGQRTRIFRPPYGSMDPASVRAVIDRGYRVILWSIDSRDWQGPGRDRIRNTVLNAVHDGAIVLFHSGGGPGQDLSGTIEALPEIIDELRRRGYELVTVPQLLDQMGSHRPERAVLCSPMP